MSSVQISSANHQHHSAARPHLTKRFPLWRLAVGGGGQQAQRHCRHQQNEQHSSARGEQRVSQPSNTGQRPARLSSENAITGSCGRTWHQSTNQCCGVRCDRHCPALPCLARPCLCPLPTAYPHLSWTGSGAAQ